MQQYSYSLTSTSVMATAVSRVLSTYELLEQILLHLQLKDLFVIQRVDTTWRDLIHRSEPIRKKKFLTPSAPVLAQTVIETSISKLFVAPPFCLNPAIGVLSVCTAWSPGTSPDQE